MSWGMGGSWNPGMAPMPSQNMGMSGYTPDQWAAMQQNWQWSQWQQYSEWQQSQYGGNKYGQQMSNMQIAPPLPSNPVPPPGPPPEVPPPPPHENNKPLYAQPEAPANNQTAQMNTNNKSWRGNEQKQHQISNEPPNQNNFAASSQPVVSEDLQKLNEEERQFDIQFKKWEDEVEEWRQKNESHPDKETYKKYEETFLTFRAELLERRKQMQLRKSSLMKDNFPNVKNSTPNNRNNISNAPVLYNQPPTNIVSNRPNTNVSQLPYNQNRNEYNSVNRGPMSQQNNSRMGNNISIPKSQNNTSMSDTNTSTFVQINRSSQGIPGLDLVPTANKPAKIPELMNITVRRTDNLAPASQEFSEISKGINNILGDEKIMNILSIFRNNSTNQHNDSGSNIPQSTFGQINNILNDSNQNMNQNFQSNNQLNTNKNKMSNNNDFQDDNKYQDEPLQDDQYQEDPYKGDEYQDDPYQGDYQDDPYRDDEYKTNYYDNDQHQNDQYQNEPFQNKKFNDGPHGPRYPPQSLIQRHNENIPRPFANRNVPYQQRPYSEQRDLQSPIVRQNPGMRQNPDQTFGNVENLPPKAPPPMKLLVEEPMFVASIIVDYAHKPARLKDREFLEPAHVIEYNHLSKTDNYKSLDFETVSRKEFLPKVKKDDDIPARNESNRDHNRPDRKLFDRSRDRHTREDSREDRRRPYSDRRYDENSKRDSYKYGDDRRKLDDDRKNQEDERRRFDLDRRKYNDQDKFTRREEPRDRYRAKKNSRSRSREPEHVSEPKFMRIDDNSANLSKVAPQSAVPSQLIMIDDILKSPGREMRPDNIVIILRGPPGSGKSYLAKLIRDKEAEYGTSVRILSIDDYFQQETEVAEKDPTTGRMVKKTVIKYEYDADSEEDYNTSLRRSFKRTVADGFFPFLIVDTINEQLKHYAEMWNYARQFGFQVYICTMELDPQICYKRNIHNRSLEEIKSIVARFTKTPAHHIVLDATTLLQSAAIQEVDMEDVESDNDVTMEDVHEELFCSINKFQDTPPSQGSSAFTSKWEKMDDVTQLARLDGTSKPLRHSKLSMEDYLQLDDWQPTHRAQPGKKTVRWADIEERREQEKMRAIGFVVGQTDWNRMTDPTMGSSALTQTKYIERVRRNQ